MSEISDNELWVDKYRPQSYVDLLSDESVNRHFLHWLKLWDKIVFNRSIVYNKKRMQNSNFINKNTKDEKPLEEVDSKGFPVHRIALLSGPPGLGKTTLAHLAAKHAGYNVVEINASDERSPSAFRQILFSSTQMKTVMGNDPRPNCLVFDEIDGAPAASIDILLKFVQGKLMPKRKKKIQKIEHESDGCQRPVICICNEPYAPSLRALRAVALIISVPEVNPTRLVERLTQIAHKEKLNVDCDSLLTLVQRSGCDVRSCLGALQYMGSTNLANNLSLGLKDTKKGLFDSWKEIMSIPMNRKGRLPIPDRVQMVLKTIQNGETDKIAQGIFHNYPEICNEKMQHIVLSLNWFQFYDEIVSLVMHHQVWSVMPYTNYAFVTWHLYLPKSQNPKISYPFCLLEVNQKLAKSTGILSAVHRSCGYDNFVLTTDFAPFLPDILTPQLRPVACQLFSSKEKSDLSRLVNIMLDFGLTLVQEKNTEGSYEYKLDPNIFDIGIFPECKAHRNLAYTIKQIIIQELEAERLRRLSNLTTNMNKDPLTNVQNSMKNQITVHPTELEKAEETQNVACTKLETLMKNGVQTDGPKYKDFFGRFITVNQEKNGIEKCQNKSYNKISPKTEKRTICVRQILMKHGVWYKYKEGYSNAVRRKVLMADLI